MGRHRVQLRPQPNRLERLDAYIEATERVRAQVRKQNVGVVISNHASYVGALDKLAQMAGKPDRGGAPHPFVLGQDKAVRVLTVMTECARATREVWAAWTQPAVPERPAAS